MKKIKVIANSKLPDFRLFWIYLWGEKHQIDSDGDSYNLASRTWTELYMSSRELENHSFEIHKINDKPLTFEVMSENIHLLHQVAYFLKRETQGVTVMEDDILVQNTGSHFNLEASLKRADLSI